MNLSRLYWRSIGAPIVDMRSNERVLWRGTTHRIWFKDSSIESVVFGNSAYGMLVWTSQRVAFRQGRGLFGFPPWRAKRADVAFEVDAVRKILFDRWESTSLWTNFSRSMGQGRLGFDLDDGRTIWFTHHLWQPWRTALRDMVDRGVFLAPIDGSAERAA